MKHLIKKNLSISQELEALTTALDHSSYINKEKIKNFSVQLNRLLLKIDKTLKTADIFSKNFLQEQRCKTLSLYARWEHLKIDSKVLEIADQAKKLIASEKKDLENQIKRLKNSITKVTQNYRLSVENRKIVRFAQILIEKIDCKELIETLKKDSMIAPIEHEQALLILELAQFIYFRDLNEAKATCQVLSNTIIHRIETLFSQYDIDFSSIFVEGSSNEIRLKSAQILVGLCDVLTLFNNKIELPDVKDLQELFHPQ